MVAINGSIFISTTSCFTLGALKSGMFCEVESKMQSEVKMARCKLQGGDGEVEMARWEWRGGDWRAGRGCQVGRCWGQGEAAWVEEAGGEGKAAGVEEAGPGRGCPCPAQEVDRVEHELRKVRKTFDEKV